MNAAQLLAKDTKLSIKKAEQIISLTKQFVDEAGSANELAENLDKACPNGQIQYFVMHGLINMTEEAGKFRGGSPTLADQILDQQASKVKRYGANAYRLSEKQVKVICRDAWGWLRPEMPQV